MPYQPGLHTASNKPYATQGGPDSGRYLFYDEILMIYRPFRSLQEVTEYLNTPISREGNPTVLIVISGVLKEYWFLNGVADSDLIEKTVDVDLSNYYTKPETLQEISDALVGYATEQWVVDQNYLKVVPSNYLKTGDNISRLVNDSGYLLPSDISNVIRYGDNISELNNDAGYITSSGLPSPQTLSWASNSGMLTITGGNSVSVDGRYSLLGHTHPISDIIGLQTILDGKVDKTTAITDGYGITVGGNLSTGVSIELNTAVIDGRYLRKDINDDNGTNTLTLGTLVSGNAQLNGTVTLGSVATGTTNDILLYGPGGVIQRKTLSIVGDFGVANAAGAKQFDVSLGSNLRFEGVNDTTVSFDPVTNKVVISSVPGTGGGGVLVSFNGRTTPAVIPVSGDYNTDMVPEVASPTNMYYTNARTIGSVLTGYATGSNSAILPTDTILQGLAKLAGQSLARASRTTTLTINGTSGNITVAGGTQSLASNRIWDVNLAPSGVTMGEYTKVTVDTFGRVTSGSSLSVSDIPNLPTSKITSGIFPPARIGSGTNSAGTYVDGLTGEWTSLPTTDLSGYYTKVQTDTLLSGKVNIADAVLSVNSKTGVVVINASDVGLGNVNNTSDLNKPISTLTQTALNGKENAFTKGGFTAGTGITLVGTLTNRLVGAGNVSAAFDTGWGDGRYALKSEIPPSLTQYLSTTPSITGGMAEQVSSGSATDIINSGAYFATSTVTGLPFPATMGVLNIRRSASTWFQLAFAASGTGFGSEEPWFNNRPGTTGYIQLASKPWVTANFASNAVFSRTVNGQVPSPGSDTGTKRYLDDSGSWTTPAGGGGSTPTDLSIQNRTSTTFQIGSSTGSAATLPISTTTLGGLMSAADKVKLDGVTAYSGGSGINISGGTISADQPWFDSRYFTYAGGNLTGNLNINNNLQIAKGVDNFRIGVGGTGYSPFNRIYLGRDDNTTQLLYGSGYTIWHAGNFNPPDYVTNTNFTWTNLAGKPSTFAPSPHTHNASDINAGVLALARIPTGTTGSTVALGNHTHTFASILSKPTTLSGYGITDAVTSARTITINGTSQTLAANRSWTIPNTTYTAGEGIIIISGEISIAQLTAGSNTRGALWYRGTTPVNGGFYGGTVFEDTYVSRLNYGGIFHAHSIVAHDPSDINLKENILRIENPIDKIKEISGYSFRWKDGHDSYQGNDYGVVAQEIEKILPDIVKDRGGVKAIKSGNGLIALLIEGIKEINNRLEKSGI